MSEILKKTHILSYFRRFHEKSQFADSVFKNGASEIILQVLPMQNGELLAELINRNDYKELNRVEP